MEEPVRLTALVNSGWCTSASPWRSSSCLDPGPWCVGATGAAGGQSTVQGSLSATHVKSGWLTARTIGIRICASGAEPSLLSPPRNVLPPHRAQLAKRFSRS